MGRFTGYSTIAILTATLIYYQRRVEVRSDGNRNLLPTGQQRENRSGIVSGSPIDSHLQGVDNIEDMLKRFIPEAVIYGTVSLYSPQEQETTMYVGSDFGAKVWLNAELQFTKIFVERMATITMILSLLRSSRG